MAINDSARKITALIAVAGLTLAARFLIINPTVAALLIRWGGYWTVALTFVGFLFLLVRHRRSAVGGIRRLCQTHRAGLICVLLAGVYLQTQEPREFKILFDEYAISGVARNMHFDREASVPGRAHYFNGRLVVMNSVVDKRPLFFPFIVSLVHDLTGYRPQNVFYVNAGLAVILLLLIYAIGFTFGGIRVGCLGVLLLAGLPLLAQNATGGGYELANLVMILLLYFVGSYYYRSAGAEGLNLFILTAALLAQVRYESILYILPVAAVVICKWRQEKRITMTWMAAVSPLLLLMPLLSNEVFMSSQSFFQTAPGQAFFASHYLPLNINWAVYYLFNLSFETTNSVLLSALGVFGIAFFILLLVKERREWLRQRRAEVVLAGLFAVVGANTILILFNFWGQWDDPMVSRFSLPLQLFMVLLVLRTAVEFLKARPLPKWALVAAGAWIIWFAAPASAQHYATSDIVTVHEYNWLMKYLSHKNPADTLTITASSVGPILYNMPAISMDVAKHRIWQVKACLGGEFYREVIVLQRFKLDYKTGKYVESGPDQLGQGFKLETIAEQRFRPELISRISKVVDVDGHAPPGFEGEKPPFARGEDLIDHLLRKLP